MQLLYCAIYILLVLSVIFLIIGITKNNNKLKIFSVVFLLLLLFIPHLWFFISNSIVLVFLYIGIYPSAGFFLLAVLAIVLLIVGKKKNNKSLVSTARNLLIGVAAIIVLLEFVAYGFYVLMAYSQGF